MSTQDIALYIIMPAIALVLFFGKGDGFRPKIARTRALQRPDPSVKPGE